MGLKNVGVLCAQKVSTPCRKLCIRPWIGYFILDLLLPGVHIEFEIHIFALTPCFIYIFSPTEPKSSDDLITP